MSGVRFSRSPIYSGLAFAAAGHVGYTISPNDSLAMSTPPMSETYFNFVEKAKYLAMLEFEQF
jgi:hypothetical protein